MWAIIFNPVQNLGLTWAKISPRANSTGQLIKRKNGISIHHPSDEYLCFHPPLVCCRLCHVGSISFICLAHLYVTWRLEAEREGIKFSVSLQLRLLSSSVLRGAAACGASPLASAASCGRCPSPQLRAASVVPHLNPTPLSPPQQLPSGRARCAPSPLPQSPPQQLQLVVYRMSPTSGVGCSAQQVCVSED